MQVIYILCQQGLPIYYSPNRKDLVDYALETNIEASIVELPLVPSLQELAEEKAENELWVKIFRGVEV